MWLVSIVLRVAADWKKKNMSEFLHEFYDWQS